MIGTWVPPVRTPATPLDVSRAYRVALRDLVGDVRPEAVAVLHAHCALETGNLKSCWGWGVGNIKASEKWAGLYTTIKLNERLMVHGKMTYVWFDPELGELVSQNGPARYPDKPSTVPPGHRQCRMRAYRTLADGIHNKIEFLVKPHWRPALDLALAGDASGYVRAIHARNYFTAAVEPYERAVVSLTKSLLPVARQTDAEPAPLPPEDEERLVLDMSESMRVEIPEWLRNRVAQITALTAQRHYDEQAAERRKARDAAVRGDDD